MLRGINLGARNRVAMPALRELFEDMGHTDVETYVQSGNVVLSAASKPDAALIVKRIAKDLGVESPVIIRSASELGKLVRGNPFKGDVSAFHVTLLDAKPKTADVKAIDRATFLPDEFAVVGRALPGRNHPQLEDRHRLTGPHRLGIARLGTREMARPRHGLSTVIGAPSLCVVV
jgi:uncharacterized protein (DUF1697 family)